MNMVGSNGEKPHDRRRKRTIKTENSINHRDAETTEKDKKRNQEFSSFCLSLCLFSSVFSVPLWLVPRLFRSCVFLRLSCGSAFLSHPLVICSFFASQTT